MLRDIRASLVARANGFNEGGDIVVMTAVDRIVEREVAEKLKQLMINAQPGTVVFEGISMAVEAQLPEKWVGGSIGFD